MHFKLLLMLLLGSDLSVTQLWRLLVLDRVQQGDDEWSPQLLSCEFHGILLKATTQRLKELVSKGAVVRQQCGSKW